MPRIPFDQRHVEFASQGITPTDVDHVDDLIDRMGEDGNKVVYRFNNVSGFWEVFLFTGNLNRPLLTRAFRGVDWV